MEHNSHNASSLNKHHLEAEEVTGEGLGMLSHAVVCGGWVA